MPLQPIDLQTLFAHINQVGKQQAVLKEASVVQQGLRGAELAKQTRQNAESVRHTEEVPEESTQIRDKQSEGGGLAHEETGGEESEQSEEKRKKHYFEDPALGKNIDISG